MTASLTTQARRHTLLILIAIIAAGTFLRLYQINSLPPGDGYDVAQYGLDALQILDGARPIFLAANFGREPLFSYLVAIVFTFTGSGALGIHLSSALIGIATIPAAYWAARELLDDALEEDASEVDAAGDDAAEDRAAEDNRSEIVKVWTPLLAALLTAVSFWHLTFSRGGLRVIWVPLFAFLVTAALWRGLHRGSRPALVLAGILLGLSQYTYQSARLLPLLVLAAFLFTYLSQRSFGRRDLLDLILTFGLALLVFAPLALFALQQPDIYNDRLQQTALFYAEGDTAQQIILIHNQVLKTVRMFFIEGDSQIQFNIPGRPSLNPFEAAALMAGIAAALWHWKRPAMLYLLAWLLLLTAPAMIADQAATAKRALGAFPAAAILIALGLSAVNALLYQKSRGQRHWPSALFALFAALALLWTAVSTFNDYFLRWSQDPTLAARFERDQTEIGLAAARLAGDETVLVSPFTVTHPAIQLNSRRHPDLRSYNGHFCIVVPAQRDRGITYLIIPGETEKSLEQLTEIYPGGSLSEGPQRPDRDEPYYLAYNIPPGSSANLDLPQTELFNWNDEIGLLDFSLSSAEAHPGDTIKITMTYLALQELVTDYTAYTHMLGPDDGSAPLAQTDSEPCRGEMDTRTWEEGDILRETINLSIPGSTPPGSYRLTTGFYTWPEIIPLPLQGQPPALLTTIEVK